MATRATSLHLRSSRLSGFALGLWACAGLIAGAAAAQESLEAPLPLTGKITADASEFELSWPDAKTLRVLNSAVYKRELGKTGPSSWRAVAPELGRSFLFRDQDLRPGIAYEFKVERSNTDIVDVGYWVAGGQVPAVEKRGTALVVVDETIAEPLATALDRFSNDLIGDGWTPIRHDVPRGRPDDPVGNLEMARTIRAWITDQHARDPFGRFTLILIGHVPVVYSGRAAPDGHEPKAHPTDLFYADTDGDWPDRGDGTLVPNAVPSDVIEFPVGRIDLANMPSATPQSEITLLRAYFDKNHHWRQGLLGDLRGAYGANGNLQDEQYQLRNLVGPETVAEGGHHDTGEEQPWLWGVDFGDWDGKTYASRANKAVFSLNFGSNKQLFSSTDNALRGMLIQPWYGVASGWGGRPAWRLHTMALGDTIGFAHLKTVNNGRRGGNYREMMEYYPTGQYLWRNPVWVNLMGDPTLRAFPTRASPQASVSTDASGASISWKPSPDADVVGYRVYRAEGADADFRPLSGDLPETATAYLDPEGTDAHLYMVRAHALKKVAAGSFYTLSQGVFARPTPRGPDLPLAAKVPAGATSPLPLADASDDVLLRAFIEGTDAGKLRRGPEGSWELETAPASVGSYTLRVSEWDGFGTREAAMTLTVGP